jgi:uncharacterized protein YbdZ (MbtH family)
MTNPFERTDQQYLVLVNDEGQHSLWPCLGKVPAGWGAIYGPSDRENCLDYINGHWTDMRPKSLIEAIQAEEVNPGCEEGDYR